jgi:hypothetical protein
MAKVNINGHSHQVEVEHDGELDTVIAAAKKLWTDTVTPEQGPAGPAFGFQGDRAGSRELFSMDLDGR